MSERRVRLQGASLYLVCEAREDGFVEAALRGGVDIVQLRVKGAGDADLLHAARRLRALCERHGALFIINDRPDLAAAVDADGVHVGQDDASVGSARELVGDERLVGLSTHTPEQIEAACASGADYIGVGPVHATPTKPGRPAVGHALVEFAAARATLPWFAIGGIEPENAAAVVAAGARRIAVVRALTEAPDPEVAARTLRRAVAAGSTPGPEVVRVGA